MKKLFAYPATFAMADAMSIATEVSLLMFKVQRGAYPVFNHWFEREGVKAYIRYSERSDPDGRHVWALCLANVSVPAALHHNGIFSKLMEQLENVAYMHHCRFYIENAASQYVMRVCERKFGPHPRYQRIEHTPGALCYDYWFTGASEMELTPPDLFTQMETEEVFGKKPA